MIVYGWRGFEAAKEELNENCPHCGKAFTMSLHVIVQYFHIFWIPIFPYSRKIVCQCSTCGVQYEKSMLQGGLKLAYQNSKARNKLPIWTFAGVILIGIGIAIGVVKGFVKDSDNEAYLSKPLTGDIYEVYADGSYTTYKVTGVKGDTVSVVTNQYTSNLESGLPDIKEMDYNDTVNLVLRSELTDMLKEGIIIGVDRTE